jgi:UDP:flavonoid glycosyltransferase YjiC (YdhE family)
VTTPRASILIVTASAGGNVPPTLAIARELAERGHAIRVLGHEALATGFDEPGIDFIPYTRARRWNPIVGRPGVRSMLAWLGLAADPGIAADVAAELARESVDAVMVDCMIPCALEPARRSGARVVLLQHAFSAYWKGQWSTSSPVGLWLRVTGTHPRRHPADLAIVTTDASLDEIDAAAVPAREVVQTGPIVPAVGAAGVPEEPPRVVVSFSTISYPGQSEALQRVLDAISHLPVTADVTVAPALAESALRFPANAQRMGFTPHERLLPGARLLVGHGGHGTTMTALAHGVPALVVAMSSWADQPLVGAAIARSGVGATVARSASVAELRSAISALLLDTSGPARALALSTAWRDGSARRVAADAILDLLDLDPLTR